MYHVVDSEHRRFLGDFDTSEEAQARLDELLGRAQSDRISVHSSSATKSTGPASRTLFA
jgi:hypothetical protein